MSGAAGAVSRHELQLGVTDSQAERTGVASSGYQDSDDGPGEQRVLRDRAEFGQRQMSPVWNTRDVYLMRISDVTFKLAPGASCWYCAIPGPDVVAALQTQTSIAEFGGFTPTRQGRGQSLRASSRCSYIDVTCRDLEGPIQDQVRPRGSLNEASSSIEC